MKTLLLMRHAKSSWKDDTLADIDRPIKKRGRKDVPKMADLMKEEDLLPDYVLCSPALRARQTVEILADELGFDEDMIKFVKSFYQADIEDYLKALSKIKDSTKKVLIVGHNPALEAFLQTITGEIEALSTSSIACIKLGIKSWKDLEEDDEVGQLVEIWRPKEL